MQERIVWPNGKIFSFTVFDDTDCSTLDNVKDMYGFLMDQGFQTTKSVWPTSGKAASTYYGENCENLQYLSWVKSLQDKGFEIGFHMAACESSLRSETIQGLEIFAKHFGHYPQSMTNHDMCLENMYWGSNRLSGINALLYNIVSQYRNHGRFRGHIDGDKYFWGDVCKEKISYVRNFVFREINTLKKCPFMPYHDSRRPLVNYWFASSDGHDVESFNDCLQESNQDRLEKEGGLCIMYTHFGLDFYKCKRLNPRFRYLMERLSKKNGWFAPVSTVLGYLLEQRGFRKRSITNRERYLLELRWLFDKLN